MKFLSSACDAIGFSKSTVFQCIEIDPTNLRLRESIHIIFHILGRYHEHQRSDRDEYIQINWENIIEGKVGMYTMVKSEILLKNFVLLTHFSYG